jgi:predicted nucleic acid-binding protein
MTAVSDTSPLNYLILIGADELLKTLFGTIAVPAAVVNELQSAHAPTEIHQWLAHKPDWVEVHQLGIPDDYLPDLGPGEREAIYLATKIGVDALLMDDAKARLAAERFNLRVFGTLGVLDAAALRGLVDFPAAVEKLKHTSFRTKPGLLDSLLKRHRG